VDFDDLQIRRDLEHAETAAADLIDEDPEHTIEFMVRQIEHIMARSAEINHPDVDLIAHCLWMGWEKALRTWKDRQDDPGSNEPADPKDYGA